MTLIQEVQDLCWEHLSCQHSKHATTSHDGHLTLLLRGAAAPASPVIFHLWTESPAAAPGALWHVANNNNEWEKTKEFKNAFLETGAWKEQGAPRLSQLLNTETLLLFSNIWASDKQLDATTFFIDLFLSLDFPHTAEWKRKCFPPQL